MNRRLRHPWGYKKIIQHLQVIKEIKYINGQSNTANGEMEGVHFWDVTRFVHHTTTYFMGF